MGTTVFEILLVGIVANYLNVSVLISPFSQNCIWKKYTV